MQQVLFHIPVLDWPIYGYGAMLFVAFFFCTWLAARLAKQEGISIENMQDVGIWIFVCGIIGARITYMIQYQIPIKYFYEIWNGGLVFYGSALGGIVGYFGAYRFILRKHGISTWKMADVIAPCGALGLCLGRFGCLLNGCCYGDVACADCPQISFPLPTAPRAEMVHRGYQTAAGFTLSSMSPKVVGRVEPSSAAYQAGLRDGDEILLIDGKAMDPFSALGFLDSWKRGKNDVVLQVRHANNREEEIGPFTPWSIGLHPTQLYESVSMALLTLLLLAYFPLRRHDGEVMVIFMLSYAVHRFLNESLRTDTDRYANGLTLSQNISIIVFVGGLVLAACIYYLRPPTPVEQPPLAAAS